MAEGGEVTKSQRLMQGLTPPGYEDKLHTNYGLSSQDAAQERRDFNQNLIHSMVTNFGFAPDAQEIEPLIMRRQAYKGYEVHEHPHLEQMTVMKDGKELKKFKDFESVRKYIDKLSGDQ